MKVFVTAQAGMIAPIVAISTPALLAMTGAGIDYARVAKARSQLQSAADTGALAGANTLRMANASSTSAGSVSENQARSSAPSLNNLSVAAAVANGEVTINLAGEVPTTVMKMFGPSFTKVAARAKARVVGSVPTCLLTLDPTVSDAFDIDSASISASGCAAFSNSTASDSMSLDKGATLTTALACSSGGATTKGGATYTPTPQTDCPARVDPLISRAAPDVGPCIATNLQVSTSTTLLPGTYCGGIDIKADANVILLPGVFVIKDGNLTTNGNASVSGNGVTLYLTGSKATMDIAGQSAINLTAPAFGNMAGILVFEDRTVALGQKHKLHSRNAPNLLGTVYLSRSTLEIGAKGGYATSSAGMAQNSAWTVVIARRLSVGDKISLVLNTNYDATAVKPPPGVAPGAQVQIVE